MLIGIVNYGIGNIASVRNALNKIGFKSLTIEIGDDFEKADKIILPGVGAFGTAMDNLTKLGFIEELNKHVVSQKKLLLGLCLGMQLLFDESEEQGNHKGLGWIKGHVESIQKKTKQLRVPHMGWNTVIKENHCVLMKDIPENELDFYFVHSYYCKCDDKRSIVATTNYGILMDVVVQKENIFGCQFHPEKSQKSGLQLLKNFCELE